VRRHELTTIVFFLSFGQHFLRDAMSSPLQLWINVFRLVSMTLQALPSVANNQNCKPVEDNPQNHRANTNATRGANTGTHGINTINCRPTP
jgi:hypothetical protein